jgi:hypothetical protein
MGGFIGSLLYAGPDGRPIQVDTCAVTVVPDATVIVPSRGSPLAMDLGDATAIDVGEFELTLTLHTGHTVALRRFGRAFDTLRRDLLEAWRTRLVACLLLQDLQELARFDGVVRRAGSSEGHVPAECRVYRSNVAVLPARGEPFQWRLADIEGVAFDRDTWEVTVVSSSGTIVISKLAKRTEEFIGCLDEARARVGQTGIAALAACLSPLDPDAVRRVASMWRDGQAVRIDQLRTIDPDLESALMHNAVDDDLRPFVEALRRRAHGAPYVGFTVAREMDDDAVASSDDDPPAIFWFVFPLGGDLVAWETASRSGRATYVFRLSVFADSRPDLREAAVTANGAAVHALTRALAAINFRRMPIYLSDEALQAARFRRYLVASRRVPAAALLRRAFVGRALHGDIETWTAQVEALVGKTGD